VSVMSNRVLAALMLMAPVVLAGGLTAPAAAQNFSDGYKFLQAVDKKEADTVNQMLRAPGGSTIVNARDVTDGHTALHIAVNRRDVPWINFLAGQGANANLADNHGVTPLMRAVQLGFDEGVDALVRAGARVDEANTAGETPLISAVHRRDMALMRTLLEAGADPDRVDNSGRSARDYAGLEGQNSATLAEIVRSARPASERNPGASYGPRL